MARVIAKLGDDVSTDVIYPGRYMATVLPTETPQFAFADDAASIALDLLVAEEGYARDIAALKVIRTHAGPDAVIAVDSNDGYDLARTKRLLADLPDYDFAWLEEITL